MYRKKKTLKKFTLGKECLVKKGGKGKKNALSKPGGRGWPGKGKAPGGARKQAPAGQGEGKERAGGKTRAGTPPGEKGPLEREWHAKRKKKKPRADRVGGGLVAGGRQVGGWTK